MITTQNESSPWPKRAFLALLGTFLLATTAFLFHDLQTNPQADTQLITMTFQFLQSLREGMLFDFLLTVRKYPLLPSLFLAVPYGLLIGTVILGGGQPETFLFLQTIPIHLLGRGLSMLAALGTIFLLHRTARMLRFGVPLAPALLLLASPMFLVFATAERPHILVAFWSVLTFYTSLLLRQEKTRLRIMLAFGSALAAFCTLQNGLLAVIFPLRAYISEGNGIAWRKFWRWQTVIGGGVFLLLASVLGYPFIWNFPLGNPFSFSFDLGHNFIPDQPKWTGAGLAVVLKYLFGSETLLSLFAILGVLRMARKRETWAFPVLLFSGAYLLLFSLYAGTAGRFLIALLPFLALLGSASLATSGRVTQGLFAIAVLLMHLQFTVLALLPNTYQQARVFLQTETIGTIATTVPHYFLGIPPTRASIAKPRMARERFYKDLPSDLPFARPIFPLERLGEAETLVMYATDPLNPPPPWRVCKDIQANAASSENMFLWTEVDWALLRLFQTRALGPGIRIYCRE